MQFRKLLPIPFLILGLFLAAVPKVIAEGAPKEVAPAAPKPRIDQAAVHDEYVNGNFETVVQRIETFRKENPAHSRADSIFIARHLGVVLAANPRTVEAGKYWMHGLLTLSPDADLSGMYASEAIERMFLGIKKEEEARTSRPGHRKWLWIGAGGSAVAATAIFVWAVLTPEAESPEPRTVVPVKL